MRLTHFSREPDEAPWVGIVRDDNTVVNVAEAGWAAGFDLPSRMRAQLGVYAWGEKLELVAAYADETDEGVYDRSDVTAHAPVLHPDKIVCVGLNYQEHIEEGGREEIPDNPVLFSKFPAAIIGPDEDIEWDPTVTEKVDYEAELVVVIGEEVRDIDEDQARDAIAGFTVGNDVSARDLQHGDGQWVRGKSLDTFAPLGPELVTPDEIADPEDLDIWTEVDGERLQDSSTENLIFGIDHLISFISQTSTLYPGDVIFTGTPPGVGVYREPPALLEEGNEVSVGIESLGVLTNGCRYR